MTIVDSPRYMTDAEILDSYCGRYVAVLQEDRALYFNEGVVVAYGEDTGNEWHDLVDLLNNKYGGDAGFVQFIKEDDLWEDLCVAFCDV